MMILIRRSSQWCSHEAFNSTEDEGSLILALRQVFIGRPRKDRISAISLYPECFFLVEQRRVNDDLISREPAVSNDRLETRLLCDGLFLIWLIILHNLKLHKNIKHDSIKKTDTLKPRGTCVHVVFLTVSN